MVSRVQTILMVVNMWSRMRNDSLPDPRLIAYL